MLAGTLSLTAIAVINTWRATDSKDRIRFEHAAQRTQDDIRKRLDTYIALLRAGSGFFAANDRVTREEFRTYVQQQKIRQHFPGIQGIGFSVKYTPTEKNNLITELQQQGIPPTQLRPEFQRDQYHAILYLEPLDQRNRAAIGYDMFTEPVRRAAMERARDLGVPAVSGRVTLVQEIDPQKQAGFLIYVPIYDGDMTPETIVDRRTALRGFVYSPFRADDLMAGILNQAEARYVDMQIYDGPRLTPNYLLHRSAPLSTNLDSARLTQTATMEVAGTTWTFVFTSRPELEAVSDRWLIPYLGVAGIAISLVLFGVIRSQVQALTKAERVAAQLQQSEVRFRTLIEQCPLSTQILSPDGRTLQVNQAWEALWGITLERLGDYNMLADPQLAEKGVLPYIQKAFAGEATAIPAILYDPNQTLPGITTYQDPLRWVQAYIYPVKDEHGQIREVVLLHEDITDRKLAEDALQESNERMALLYDMSSSLLLHEQPKTFISSLFSQLSNHLKLEVYFNYLFDPHQQVLRLHAFSGVSEAVIQPLAEIKLGQSVSGTVAQSHQPLIREHIQQSSDANTEFLRSLQINAYACYPLLSRNQLMGTLSFGSRNRPLFDADELALMQSVCDQVATALERAHLLAKLQHQTEELIQANRSKDEFLATLSHELRTPLNAMMGWSTLLRTRQFDQATAARALETIERNTKSLAQLIEDLLDVSRIISGKIRLTLHPVHLIPVIQAAIDTVHPAAEVKNIQILTDLDPTVGTVMADATRLQQVIWNLLANAIKFTPNGGRVAVQLTARQGKGSSLNKTELPSFDAAQIIVTDTGKGISSAFLPHVFDRFRQADSKTTRAQGGLGLGLSIVRHLVELQGGTVLADSPGEGQGATFIVELPLGGSTTPPTDPLPGSTPSPVDTTSALIRPLSDIRVLLVDDEADARELGAMILEQAGATVITVASAEAAIDTLIRLQPQVLISDIGMPGEDGYTLIRKVRALAVTQGGQVPAIALTAYARAEDRWQALQAGFQQHITKPISPPALIAAVTRLVKPDG